MQENQVSHELLKEVLNICGVSTDKKFYNKMLKFSGSINKSLGIIYFIIDLDISPDITKYLKNIMPKSKKQAKKYIPEIIEKRNQETLCLKDVIDFFDKIAQQSGHLENLSTIENKTNIENGASSKSLYKIIHKTSGRRIKYSFRCAMCGHDHTFGRLYKYEGRDIEVCDFCIGKKTSTKLIYTPMGNKR